MEGTCSVCGKAARFLVSRNRGVWVHEDTQHWKSRTPREHDVNTYVEVPRRRVPA